MKNKGKKCSANSCNNKAFCKGYCTKHYQQMYFKGKLKEEPNFVYVEGLCKIIGCGKQVLSKGLCQNHYLKEKQ